MNPVVPESGADRLRSAATLIRTGWVRGGLVSVDRAGNISRCAIGAILHMTPDDLTFAARWCGELGLLADDPTASAAVDGLHRYLTHHDGEHRTRIAFTPGPFVVRDVEEWNDGAPDAELVAAVMEKSAAWLEEGGHA